MLLVSTYRIDEGLAECEMALKLDPSSPYNKTTIAEVLAIRRRPKELERGLVLAREATSQLPGDPHSLEVLCGLLIETRNRAETESCVERLMTVDPKGLIANYLSALLAIDHGQWYWARKKLEEAHAAGLDEPDYQRLLAAISDGETRSDASHSRRSVKLPSPDFVWAVLWVVFGWLAVMCILLITGDALSSSMLKAIDRMNPKDGVVGGSRKLYKGVLVLAGLYFYFSIPFLLVAVISGGLGILYFFVAQDALPIYLLFVLGVGVIGTLSAVLRSLFVRTPPAALGLRTELAHQPRLRALLDEVAHAVAARRIDAAYLVPGTEITITESSSLWQSLCGKTEERSAILGVGAFSGLTQLQLRSLIAHELGRFSNAHTAGGGVVLGVRRSLAAIIVRLSKTGLKNALNPAWWFLRGYYRLYMRMSQGASRLQEVLADRAAIAAYGTNAFVSAHRKLISRSVEFQHQVDMVIREVVDTGSALPNVYEYVPRAAANPEALAKSAEKKLAAEPSLTHGLPSPRKRIEWAESMAVERAAQGGDDEPVWALFDDREALERAMTAELRIRLFVKRGLSIAETEHQAEEREHLEQDKQTIAVLVARGDPLTTPRSVQHWACFNTAQDRARFIAEAKSSGFESEEDDRDPGESDPFGVILTRTDRVDLESIHAVVMNLVTMANRYSGDYDGWESPVQEP
ncbi:MAG: Zn-dependent protease with chaperone function [Myxococcales bacterium]|nr:Zn-dependent protease with chaperone function [Myxococcales bacterium]